MVSMYLVKEAVVRSTGLHDVQRTFSCIVED